MHCSVFVHSVAAHGVDDDGDDECDDDDDGNACDG